MLDWMRKLLGLLLIASVAACGGGDGDDDHRPTNLVQVAQADARFSILVEAVQAAGLAQTLSAPGPSTLFAPTNEAFAALLAELGVTDILASNGVIHVIDKVVLPAP